MIDLLYTSQHKSDHVKQHSS